MRYEYRQNDNPSAMPLGTATISTHRSERTAMAAAAKEGRRWDRAVRESSGALAGHYLQRLVVRVGDDGAEEIVWSGDPRAADPADVW